MYLSWGDTRFQKDTCEMQNMQAKRYSSQGCWPPFLACSKLFILFCYGGGEQKGEKEARVPLFNKSFKLERSSHCKDAMWSQAIYQKVIDCLSTISQGEEAWTITILRSVLQLESTEAHLIFISCDAEVFCVEFPLACNPPGTISKIKSFRSNLIDYQIMTINS